MDIEAIKKEFHEYADRMSVIRQLSSPGIKRYDSADDYSERLQDNFREIGRLAAINREMLDNELYPLLDSEESLDEGLADELEKLAEMLLSIADMEGGFENLDLPVSAMIRGRLLKDAEAGGDLSVRIRRMDAEIDACYSMMNMTERITSHPQISAAYKKRGLTIGEEFLSFLDKDIFPRIKDMECRERVLSGARFAAAFYEAGYSNQAEIERNLFILDRIMEVCNDPFYQEAVPDLDWRYFRFRTLESYIFCADAGKINGFSKDQLDQICSRADELHILCRSDPEYFKTIKGYAFYPINSAKWYYLAGRISDEEYRRILLNAYSSRDKEDTGVDGGYFNVLVPLELIRMIDPENYTAEDADLLKNVYEELCAYFFNLSNDGTMSFMLQYFSDIVSRYIEIPSGVGLEEFMLRCLAAIHPPTYVHSCMVGQISERLCFHLLRYRPELFKGICGCETKAEVFDSKDRIINFAYHSALMHDAGKIYIIDTILVYGRRLLDSEFELIKSHPDMGYELLNMHVSTRPYAEVALFHHKWYDDSKGYPFDKRSGDSKYKTIIDLVQCADCLDAATDTVGRSYNKGKNIAGFMGELKEGCGTRYAPWLYELFEHEEVRADIEYLLDKGRKNNYRETYSLLRNVQVKAN